MKVDVTQEDIDRGEHSCEACPVAKALNRLTGLPWHVTHLSASLWSRTSLVVRVLLPSEVAVWILSYDRGRMSDGSWIASAKPLPFSFDFPWPPSPEAA